MATNSDAMAPRSADRRGQTGADRRNRRQDAGRNRRGLVEQRGQGYLRADIGGRLAAILFATIGVTSLMRVPVVHLDRLHFIGLCATGIVAGLLGLAAWFANWERLLPHYALVVELLAFTLVATANWSEPNPWTYGSLFAAVFVWIGLVRPLRATMWAIVPASAAYFIPMLWVRTGATRWWLGAVTNLVLAAMLGIALAWAGEQLRRAQTQGRRRLSGLEAVLASTAALAQPLEPALVIDMTAQIGMQAFDADAVLLLGGAARPGALEVLQQRHWAGCERGTVIEFPASLAAELAGGTAMAAPPGWLSGAPETGGETQLIPLMTGTGLAGLLVVWWRWAVQDYGSRLDQDLAATFGRQAGAALERAHAIGRLQSATMIDPLTGLGNRRAADSILETLQPGDAIVMIDLDHFKRVNDEFGHPAGDAALRQLGSFLSSTLREGDHVARYGGEEFVMFVRRIHPAAIESLLERLRLLWNERSPITTFSVGAAVHQSGADPRVTLQAADIALYQAKERGRDRVVVAV